MKVISLVILSACIALVHSGCSGQKAMDSTENTVDTMVENSMSQPMQPQTKDTNTKTM